MRRVMGTIEGAVGRAGGLGRLFSGLNMPVETQCLAAPAPPLAKAVAKRSLAEGLTMGAKASNQPVKFAMEHTRNESTIHRYLISQQ